jgi:hypothetical protein
MIEITIDDHAVLATLRNLQHATGNLRPALKESFVTATAPDGRTASCQPRPIKTTVYSPLAAASPVIPSIINCWAMT